VLAVPVCAPEAVDRLAAEADEVVCLQAPESFLGVGRWYDDFSPTSDHEVIALLNAAQRPPPAEGRVGRNRPGTGATGSTPRRFNP
jgi:putative phosphoribosyl transferase